jgi:SAM-dependent methyltransferase
MQDTSNTRRHYEELLARYYTWMCGDFDDRVEQTIQFFQTHGIPAGPGAAMDLGCGSGIQTAALSKMGYSVAAVDFNADLLQELRERLAGAAVGTLEMDLTQLPDFELGNGYDVVVCMGDTLTHLPSFDAVERLLVHAAEKLLKAGGRLVLGFRDLSVELTGTDRIIPVRLDRDRVMLAFLEFTPTHVLVHDTVLDRSGDEWAMNKSVYAKLRLQPDTVVNILEKSGLRIDSSESQRGVRHLLAVK